MSGQADYPRLERALADIEPPRGADGEKKSRAARLRHWAFIAALAAVYFIAGRLGLSLATAHPSATAVWPPTGIALAALLLYGVSAWPAVFLGAFLVNVATAASWPVSLGIAFGNTLEAACAATLVARFASGRHAFDKPQDIFRFTLLAGLLSTAACAAVGATTLCLGGLAHWADFRWIWLTWWLGDAGGALVVTPTLLLWINNPWFFPTPHRAMEGALLTSSLLLTSGLVFAPLLGLHKNYPIDFLCIPVLVWSAFRFGRRHTASAIFLLSIAAVWGTLHGYGPFVGETQNGNLLLLQGFMIITSVMSLALAAVVAEYRKAAEQLRREYDKLEVRVTQRTQALTEAGHALHASEENFRLVVESIKDYSILRLSPEGRIIGWNLGAQRMNGYAAEEMIGRQISRLYPPEDIEAGKPQAALELAAKEGRFKTECWHRRKDGARYWAGIVVTALKDETGHLEGFVEITRDETERKIMDQTLEHETAELARSNLELEGFASAASHDLMEPLRKIIAFGDLLRKQPLDEAGQDFLARVRNAASRMIKLVEDLLAYSKVLGDTRPFESVNLNLVVAEILSDLENVITKKKAAISVSQLPVIDALPFQMRQLLQNLITNALKFHRKDESPHIAITSSATPAGYALITVSDQGIGFEDKNAENIFQPFLRLHTRAEYEGSGIGLAICRRIMLRHGGWISTRSTPGKGSDFIVTLPFRAAP